MTDHLPGVIRNALDLLEQSSGPDLSKDQVRTFKNAVYLLNDAMEDFPSYREHGQRIKLTRTLFLLSALSTRKTPLDCDLWLEYLMLFCIDLKREILSVKTREPALFDFFISFIHQHLNDIAPGLRANVEEFLEEMG
jgi:hypothetical protein